MRYLCSLFGASTDDLVTAETPAGFLSLFSNILIAFSVMLKCLMLTLYHTNC